MITRILLFLALAFGVFVTPSWAQACGGEEANCFTFDATHTTFTYDNFGGGDTSRLTVQFETVLTRFALSVRVSYPHDLNFPCEGTCPTIRLDPKEFPQGTVCAQHAT